MRRLLSRLKTTGRCVAGVCLLMLVAGSGPANAFSLGERVGSVPWMEQLSGWLILAMVVGVWWLLSTLSSHLIWKWLDDAPLAARLSLGFFALAMMLLVHFFVFKMSLTWLIVLIGLLVVFFVILIFSYMQVRSRTSALTS